MASRKRTGPRLNPRGQEHNENLGVTVRWGPRIRPDGTTGDWAVELRTTSRTARRYRLKTFDDELSASSYFKLALGEGFAGPTVSAATIDERLDDARALVLSRRPYPLAPDVNFLLAVDRVRSESTDGRYHSVGDGISVILRDRQQIPTDVDAFEGWLTECLALLHTRHAYATTAVSQDTAKHRTRFFTRALRCLADYSRLIHGGELYLSALARVETIVKDGKRQLRSQLTLRDTYRPLTLPDVQRFLADFNSLAARLHILKTLAMAFRPGETERCTPDKIIQGKLIVRSVVTKTERTAHRLVNPEAPLSLRVLTRLQAEAGFTPAREELQLLANHSPPARVLRTTAACHLLYSGAGVEVVRQRLAHASIDMAVRHYLSFPIPDVGSRTPEEYYSLPEQLLVDGKDVAPCAGFPWDRWVLLETLRQVRDHAPGSFELLKEIVLEESGAVRRTLNKVESF
jgi:hypothetical protein